MSGVHNQRSSNLSNTKQLQSAIALKSYQKEWFSQIRIKNDLGIPFGICNADECEEIFTVFGMPVIVVQWWCAIIAAKRMAAHYGNVLAKFGWDMDQYNSLGLGVTLDKSSEIEPPWGGLPKPAIIIGSTECDASLVSKEIWAREWGTNFFPLDRGTSNKGTAWDSIPGWWERIKDHWDDMIDPHLLNYRIEQEKQLVRYIEDITGLRFSIAKLNEVMELINLQENYWTKTRDLIAKTYPCPVSLSDQLSMYPAQWFRGTNEGLSLVKSFYNEVADRVNKGEATYHKEKIRLMWLSAGLWTNTSFYQYFEKTYGAVFVCSIYTSIAADAYARSILDDDPFKTMVGRHILLPLQSSDWLLKEAKLHGCKGAIGFGDPSNPSKIAKYFEENGIPVLEIPGHNVDTRQWDEDTIRSLASEFFEKKILAK